MTVNPSEQLQPSLKIDAQEYLSKIKPEDRETIERVIPLFRQTMQQLGRSGVILAVGSSLLRTGYHDIDLLIVLKTLPTDPVLAQFPNRLAHAQAEMKIINGLVIGMIQQDSNFTLDRLIMPYQDHQLDTPDIVGHRGTITILNNQHDLLLDFIRGPITSSVKNVIAAETRPFSILTDMSNEDL